MDTWIFNNFGNDFIIRYFTLIEMSYMDYKNKDFILIMNISPYQSDQVVQYIKNPIFSVKLFIK